MEFNSPAFEPTFSLTPLMQRQLLVVDQAVGFVNAVRLQPQWLTDIHNTALVPEAVASLQIEGNTLSLEAAFDLATTPSEELVTQKISNSEREFLNYLRAFDAIDELKGNKSYRPSLGDLLNIHGMLMDGVRGGARGIGQLRCEDVRVGDVLDGEVVVHHQPPHWSEVENHLRELFDWINRSVQVLTQGQRNRNEVDHWVHTVIIAGIVHHRLVWIHPFLDGNGRSTRMFSTLLLHWRGYDFKCLFSLSDYYNSNRDKYYTMLRTADRQGDYTPWLEYVLGGFSRQMRAVQAKALKAAVGVASESSNDSEVADIASSAPTKG